MAGGWEHLAGLQQLAYLSLHECDLEAVPKELAQLTAPTSLKLSVSPITSSWQHLAGMQQLAALWVDCCDLTAVPRVSSLLTALTRLNINRNPIASGFDSMIGSAGRHAKAAGGGEAGGQPLPGAAVACALTAASGAGAHHRGGTAHDITAPQHTGPTRGHCQ